MQQFPPATPRSTPATALPAASEKDWVSIVFLAGTPLIGIAGTAIYTALMGFELWMLGLFAVLYFLVGLSICAGYHRFFSHKTYECARPVQLFYLIFGAFAAQNNVLAWASGHRRHHRHVDDDWDPYNIKRGFWWAHILWVVDRKANDFSNVPDLVKNKLVIWQQRWYLWLVWAGGLFLPAGIGALCGDVVAGILWGGFLRIVVVHHTTFFVNSLSHSFGKPSYDPAVSARDNWFVALLTMGEGYHSFHHKFPADYRNGIRWYHWDPAKWFIWGLQRVGLAQRLRRTERRRIERARIAASSAAADRPLGAQVEPQV
jgi:stearoyl-CoA desaturase (delta-9 desaturase)